MERPTESYQATSKRTKLSSAAKPATCTLLSAAVALPALVEKTRPQSSESYSEAKTVPVKVRTSVIPNRRKKTLQGEVKKHVEAGSALYTDFLLSYEGLEGQYAHKVVDHAVQYVDGNVHTNSLENFWSLLKRAISGTYVSVEPFHLFRYLDEQAFRFNERTLTDAQRFSAAVSKIVGKRLTWDALTGKNEEHTFLRP
jgi:transposase-like protein